MPLYRRVARKGFSNHPFKKIFLPVSLSDISRYFAEGDVVSLESLKAKGLAKGKDVQVKILANGEIDKKVVVQGLVLSVSAAEKIQKAGGEIQE